MSEKTNILIADDHALIRKGLKQVLELNGSFEVEEAEDGKKALKAIENRKPEIVILDVEMPEMSGFEVAKIIHQRALSLNVIFLTMYSDESVFNSAMDIGVKGYVLKENTVSEIENCIETVKKGGYYLSPSISEFLIRRNQRVMTPASDQKGLDLLTPTEQHILKLLAQMKTNQELAEELGISVRTIQNHRNNICNKLELRGAHALLKYAIDNQLLL